MKTVTQSLLEEFDANLHIYKRCTEQIHDLLKRLLGDNNFNFHEVTSRTKTKDSFQNKITKEGNNYNTLCDIKDISAFRIITYFSDDVDNIATLIENEFNIDQGNSIDKRKLHDPDRFGYLSLHYVANLNDERSALSEYKSICTIPFEIQIRSILQHAWAEIEHDLGYKIKESIPNEIRRSFSRLAGVLELSDIEFISIRNSLEKYKSELPVAIVNEPENVDINKDSLTEFLTSNPTQIEMASIIQKHSANKLFIPQDVDTYISMCKYFQIANINDLSQLFIKEKNNIITLTSEWLGDKIHPNLSAGLTLFYLFYVLVGKSLDVAKVENYMRKFRIDPTKITSTSKRLVDICRTFQT